MAVVGSAQIVPDSPEGQFEVGRYSSTNRWRVITNSLADNEFTVTAAPGIPRMFDPHPSNPFLRAREFSAKRMSPNNLAWLVTVVYRTPDRIEGHGGNNNDSGGGTQRDQANDFQNPLSEFPEVKFDTTGREDLLTQIYDINTGTLKPVTASNGEPFDPPPKQLQRAIALTISRNEDINAPHPAIGMTYINTVNSDYFWGLPPGSWLCKDVSAQRQQRNLPSGAPIPFLKVVYQFEARPDWDIVILDSGSYYLLPPAASTSNPFLPFLPPSNLWVPLDQAVFAAATVTPSAFRRRQFQTQEGHPCHGPLNGQGGALPAASTFTASSTTSRLTVPAPTTTNPGCWVNGMACQVFNTGGALPAPLSPFAVYYTMSVDLDANTFRLTTNPVTQSFAIRPVGLVSGTDVLNMSNNAQLVNIVVGMRVSGSGIPTGATVTAVTPGPGGGGPSVTISANVVSTTTNGTVNFTGVVSNVALTDAGSGVNTILPLGLFLRVRPYNRIPFGPLNLPNSFNDVA